MQFGKAAGSKRKLKEELKKGKGGSIRFVPKDGLLLVRFIDEPEEWIQYSEAWDNASKASWPVPDDESAEGYVTRDSDDNIRISSRYLVNAIDVDKDAMIALQLPKDLVAQLSRYSEKMGQLTNRDFELYRDGDGLDTTYGFSPEDKRRINKDKYKALDLEKILIDKYNSVWGDDEDEDGDEEDTRPTTRKKKTSTTKKKSTSTAKSGSKTTTKRSKKRTRR